MFESNAMKVIEQTVAILFVDDADLMTKGKNDVMKMQKILNIYDKLFGTTNRLIETDKSTYYAWK